MSTVDMEDAELLKQLEQQAAEPPSGGGSDEEAALLNEGVSTNIELQTVVPKGEYVVKFAEIEVRRGKPKRDPKTGVERQGTLYMRCKLEILQGDFAGRSIYDNLMLEGDGAPRLARVASVLGRYDRDAKCMTGFKNNTPTAGDIKNWLLGQVVLVETLVEPERNDAATGKTFPAKAAVTFGGYHEAPSANVPAEAGPPGSWG